MPQSKQCFLNLSNAQILNAVFFSRNAFPWALLWPKQHWPHGCQTEANLVLIVGGQICICAIRIALCISVWGAWLKSHEKTLNPLIVHHSIGPCLKCTSVGTVYVKSSRGQLVRNCTEWKLKMWVCPLTYNNTSSSQKEHLMEPAMIHN